MPGTGESIGYDLDVGGAKEAGGDYPCVFNLKNLKKMLVATGFFGNSLMNWIESDPVNFY